MTSRTTVSTFAAVAVLFALAASIDAATIPVPNASFEVRGTYDPFPESTDKYLQYGRESWRHFEIESNGGPIRIWNPGLAGVDDTTQGAIDTGFGGNAAEGTYAVLVRSRYNDDRPGSAPRVRDFEAITQILPDTFDPTMTYTLTAKVGRPGGSINTITDWYGYALQLAVGGTNVDGASYAGRVDGGTVIAQDSSAIVPIGSFVTASVTYTPNAADAALAGQPLQIRLAALENPNDHALTGWVVFDDVRLDGTVVPEPSTITMTLLALGFIGILWRRRRA
ncbi:MAG: PEP-CTERM sorting domain-containing protein [Candidatus Nealsonbacteria bacterium]|nr:PEP-CTERM sorting domain-containing protein [Candidatus Nealsonbacteria bacterium]